MPAGRRECGRAADDDRHVGRIGPVGRAADAGAAGHGRRLRGGGRAGRRPGRAGRRVVVRRWPARMGGPEERAPVLGGRACGARETVAALAAGRRRRRRRRWWQTVRLLVDDHGTGGPGAALVGRVLRQGGVRGAARRQAQRPPGVRHVDERAAGDERRRHR